MSSLFFHTTSARFDNLLLFRWTSNWNFIYQKQIITSYFQLERICSVFNWDQLPFRFLLFLSQSLTLALSPSLSLCIDSLLLSLSEHVQVICTNTTLITCVIEFGPVKRRRNKLKVSLFDSRYTYSFYSRYRYSYEREHMESVSLFLPFESEKMFKSVAMRTKRVWDRWR